MKSTWSVNKLEFLDEVKTKSEESIFAQKIVGDDFVPIQMSPIDAISKVIEHRRRSLYDELCIEVSLSEYPRIRSSKSPILIEENYFLDDTLEALDTEDLAERITQESPKYVTPKIHIYVLVHGLGGCQTDLLAYKNHISLINPNAEFIISNKNSSHNSERDINELAQNLALEIEADMHFYDVRNVDKISFIGFSLGGIIIRAALPLISKYKAKFYGYISLATPHLGLKLKKKHIAAGLWFMKVFSNKRCLEQLNLEDNDDVTETFMYQLSKSEGLSWFKKVYFFASSQDTYCPFGSARVQVFNEQIMDQNYCPELLEMAENILSRVTAS